MPSARRSQIFPWTGLSSVGRLNQVSRLQGGSLLGGSILPLISTNHENGVGVPVSFTFNRASERDVVTTTDGISPWFQTAKSGELRLWGERRVENLQFEPPSAWSKTIGGAGAFPITTSNFADGVNGASLTATRAQLGTGGTGGGDLSRLRQDVNPTRTGEVVSSVWLRLNTGTSVDIVFGGLAAAAVITVTNQWQRFAIASSSGTLIGRLDLEARGSVSGNTVVDLLIDDGTSFGAQIELAQPFNGMGNGVPSEFVYRNTTYNVNVPNVRYFATTNPFTINQTTHLVETGSSAPIVGGGFLREAAATYRVPDSNDYNAASWTLGDMSATDLGLTEIGYRTHELDAGVLDSFHRMFAFATFNAGGACSMLVKAGTGQFLNMGPAAAEYATFDVVNGVVTEEVGGKGYIYDLGDGWYLCFFYADSNGFIYQIVISDTGTPGTRDNSFQAANETFQLANAQAATEPYFSPAVTSGGTFVAQTDSLSGTDWPAETSALVDCTVIGSADQQANLLGFGSAVGNVFSLPNATDVQLNVGTIQATATATTSLDTERHKFAFSLKDAERIVVNDEGQTDTDTVGAAAQGAIVIGSANNGSGTPVLLHLWNIYDQTQTEAELLALVGAPPPPPVPTPLRVWDID